MAGVKYDAHYNVTTVDPPELVYFIREHHPDVKFTRPEMPLLKRMLLKKFPPMRHQRWCCEIYKEQGGSGRRIITGVRWAESAKRSRRKMVEHCFRDKSKIYVNPIIDWTDGDVWQFITSNNIPYCKLYDEGFERLGCLFCPMARNAMRKHEVERYPRFEKVFRKYFRKLFDERVLRGKPFTKWIDGDSMFEWWINETGEKFDPDQMVMFE
jgi:phosphoadenosine phosphosulfate reductase